MTEHVVQFQGLLGAEPLGVTINESVGRADLQWLFDLGARCSAAVEAGPGCWIADLPSGLGLSMGDDLLSDLRSRHPIKTTSPFEGSDHIAGGVWRLPDTVSQARSESGIALLEFARHATDLPMHTHEHAGRCILGAKGEGSYYISSESLSEFTGSDIQAIPAIPGRVFLFTSHVMHTFGTADQAVTLLSYQDPFIDFDDPRQYTLPEKTICPAAL